MTTKEIAVLKQKGLSADSIYQLAAGELNLFAVAFFGERGKPGDKQRLGRVWKRICVLFKRD